MPLHVVGADGTILSANQAELDLLGYAREEYVGRNIAEFHADPPVIRDILARLSAAETISEYEARLRCRDGSIKHVLITSNARFDAGRFVNTRCFTRDITAQKRVEELNAQTADYLEGLMEGFVAYDQDWRMTYMNAAGERILGRRRDDVLGKTWHQAFPHAVGNPVDQMYQRVMRTPRRRAHGVLLPALPALARDQRLAGEERRRRGVLPRRHRPRDPQPGRPHARRRARPRARGAGGDRRRDRGERRAVRRVLLQRERTKRGESYMLYSLSGVPREAFSKFPMPRNTAVFAPTFEGSGVVRSDDITKDARYGKSAPHHGMPQGHLPVRSYLAVPVISRSGEVLGGLFFGHEQAAVFTERAERLVAGIAAQAAIAMDNARLYRAEQEAAAKLREADRRKDEFLATLAHELRNPLAPIRTGLHLLRITQPGSDSAEQARAMMERQLTHLIRLVDDLLEVSRISRGKIDLRRSPIELAAVVLSAVETTRPAIEAARHRLEISLPAQPLTVDADFVRLAQVLANLLNNAAKYTDPGGRIALSVRGEGAEAVISVRDNGVGIPAELLPRVFDMFAQVDRTLDRAQGGLGIGLALAKSLVEMHGGHHPGGERRTRPGQRIHRAPAGDRVDGTTGHWRRPVSRLPQARQRATPRARGRRQRRRRAESRPAARPDGLRGADRARRRGGDRSGALGPAAPRAARHQHARDRRLQRGAALKQDLAFRDVPFIAVTGLGREADRDRAREAGFNEHLVKPVSPEALREVLERF